MLDDDAFCSPRCFQASYFFGNFALSPVLVFHAWTFLKLLQLAAKPAVKSPNVMAPNYLTAKDEAVGDK